MTKQFETTLPPAVQESLDYLRSLIEDPRIGVPFGARGAFTTVLVSALSDVLIELEGRAQAPAPAVQPSDVTELIDMAREYEDRAASTNSGVGQGYFMRVAASFRRRAVLLRKIAASLPAPPSTGASKGE